MLDCCISIRIENDNSKDPMHRIDPNIHWMMSKLPMNVLQTFVHDWMIEIDKAFLCHKNEG